MRILMLSNLYPPNVVGGYERLCFEVASGLAELGHDVAVLTSRHVGKVATYPKQTVLRELDLLTGPDIYTPFPGTAAERADISQRNVRSLQRVLEQIRPDVVFAWNLFFLDPSMLTALEQSRSRTVVMLTDNWLLVMRNPGFVSAYFRDSVHGEAPFAAPVPRSRLRLLAARLRAWLRGRAQPAPTGRSRLQAIFGSVFMRDLYHAGGISFAREVVVHNGVTLAAPDSAPSRDRGALVAPGTLHLLFAGRLVDLKGADTAVAAMPLLDPATLGVARLRLTIVGDTQDQAYMRTLTDLIGGSPCAADIVIRPTVPEDALPALFAAHDIYLFPSLYEPFSLTLIHALSCGIPTIASRTGGNPEIIQDGKEGLLFDKGSAADLARAIRMLARDPALRVRLSGAARATAGRFTFARMLGEMDRFLSSPP